MGTPIESGAGEEVQGNIPDQDNSPGPNPAWNDVLSVLPEQFHSVVTPHFQKWDQSAQSQVEKANNSLKEFEGFKPFAEHGITPDEIEQGLRLMFEINNNPQNVYQALGNAYNFGNSPGAGNAASAEDDDEGIDQSTIDPDILNKLNQHDGLLQAVSQIVLNDAQAKQAATADAELNSELDKLREDHGDYDEDYVLTKMMNGMSGEDAVGAYKALVAQFAPKPFAPTLLGNNSGGGSGIPSNAIDPTKLSGPETRNLVAQMLAAAKNQT
jgi:hypothetical protein